MPPSHQSRQPQRHQVRRHRLIAATKMRSSERVIRGRLERLG
jgi:hypothetical protein